MGYTTDFEGRFSLNKKLDIDTQDFLTRLNETRRMKRKSTIGGVYYGVDGEFYVHGEGFAGQYDEESVVDYNRPPSTQPGLWCQWRPSDDGMHIQWDGGEKFYNYVEWIKYIITSVLAPKGYELNGEVHWQGEDSQDFGVIAIQKNKVFILEGQKSYSEPKEA